MNLGTYTSIFTEHNKTRYGLLSGEKKKKKPNKKTKQVVLHYFYLFIFFILIRKLSEDNFQLNGK